MAYDNQYLRGLGVYDDRQRTQAAIQNQQFQQALAQRQQELAQQQFGLHSDQVHQQMDQSGQQFQWNKTLFDQGQQEKSAAQQFLPSLFTNQPQISSPGFAGGTWSPEQVGPPPPQSDVADFMQSPQQQFSPQQQQMMGQMNPQMLEKFAQMQLSERVRKETEQRAHLMKLFAAQKSTEAINQTPTLTPEQKQVATAQIWSEFGGMHGFPGTMMNTMMGQGPADIANIRADSAENVANIRANAPGRGGKAMPQIDPQVLTALRSGSPEEQDAAAAALAGQGVSFHQIHEYAKGAGSAPANTPTNSFQFQAEKAHRANRAKIASAMIMAGTDPKEVLSLLDTLEPPPQAQQQPAPQAPSIQRQQAAPSQGGPMDLNAAKQKALSEGISDPAAFKARVLQLMGGNQ